MNKLIIFLISLELLIGCTEANVVIEKTGYVVKDEHAPLEIVIIDSCEYLYGPWGNATVFTHKGNCKHCKQNINE